MTFIEKIQSWLNASSQKQGETNIIGDTPQEESSKWPSAAEKREALSQARRDPAAIQWRSNPNRYNLVDELSFTPSCPYCKKSLGHRERPKRRSSFACPLCSNRVFVDPWHRIFTSCYLTTKQGLIAKYLGKLNDLPGAAGTSFDFWWKAQEIEWTKQRFPLTEQQAGDVLWGLMNYSVLMMREILPIDEVKFFAPYSKELQLTMKNYRDEERRLVITKLSNGGKNKPTTTLICPNCSKSLGTTNKPARRSNRKCKLCKDTIYVDPYQTLFDSCFLTEQQHFLVRILNSLGQRVDFRATERDFDRARKSLALQEPLNNFEIVRVLQAIGLMNIDLAKKREDREFAEYCRLMRGHVGANSKPNYGDVNFLHEILTELETVTAHWR